MFDFEKLDVYQKTLKLNQQIFALLKANSAIDDFLKDQIKRASSSILANIAEGAGRFNSTDKKRFYIISRGSAYESIALLSLVYKTCSITPAYSEAEFRIELHEIVRMLYGMIKNTSDRPFR